MAERADHEMVSIHVDLNRKIPAQAEALEILYAYQRQTGLSKKDALVFLLLSFHHSFGGTEDKEILGKPGPQDSDKLIKEPGSRNKKDKTSMDKIVPADEAKDRFALDMEHFLDDNYENFI